MFWGLLYTNLPFGIESEIPEHKVCDYRCIAAMCDDSNRGLKLRMMGSTRHDHRQAASGYHVSSSSCRQQTKLSAILFDRVI
jgi:hypothetical protein